MRDLVKKLTDTYGPSGNEELVSQVIREEIESYVDEIKTDVMGNLIGIKKGNGKGKRIMLAAHMDQIGLMVTHIDDKGFLRFSNLGGISVANSINRRVLFQNGVAGVIGYETEIDSWKDITMAKLYIDTECQAKKRLKS